MASIGFLPGNDTADVYRNANGPPAAPDVAGVAIHVIPRFRNIKGDFSLGFTYTHILCLPLTADVRDNFPTSSNGDKLFVPDQNGQVFFTVAYVERARLGQGLDYKRAYCTLSVATYPTQEG